MMIGCTALPSDSANIFADEQIKESGDFTLVGQRRDVLTNSVDGIENITWLNGADTLLVSGGGGKYVDTFGPGLRFSGSLQSSEQATGFSSPLRPIGNTGVLRVMAEYDGKQINSILLYNDLRHSVSERLLSFAPSGQSGALTSPAIFAGSKDGIYIAVVVVDKPASFGSPGSQRVKVLKMGDPRYSKAYDVPRAASSMAFSESGRQIAVGFSDGRFMVIDLQSDAPGRVYETGVQQSCDSVLFNKTGNLLALGYSSFNPKPLGSVELRDPYDNRLEASLTFDSGTFNGVAGAPNVKSLSWDVQKDILALGSSSKVQAWIKPAEYAAVVFTHSMPINSAGFAKFSGYSVAFSNSGVLAVAAGHTVLLYRSR